MSRPAVSMQRDPGLRRAAIWLSLVLPVAWAIPFDDASSHPVLKVAVLTCGLPCVAALWVAWTTFHGARRTNVTLHVEDHGLFVDGQSAPAFTHGSASALDNGRAHLDLRVGLRLHRFEVDSLATARELLGSIGLDRREGTSLFRVKHIGSHSGYALFAAILAVPVGITGAMLFGALFGATDIATALGLGVVVLGVLCPFVLELLMRARLVVGADGIHLQSPGRKTFLANTRIRAIRRLPIKGAVSPGVELVLDDGTSLKLDTRAERFRTGAWRTDPIYDAMTAARAPIVTREATNRRASTAVAVSLERGQRSTHDWVTAVRGAAAGATNYRLATVAPHDLFGVLDDANASVEARAAAAIALGANTEHAPRLRVLADDLADPAVRRIAIRVAEGAELDELERELERVVPAPRSVST